MMYNTKSQWLLILSIAFLLICTTLEAQKSRVPAERNRTDRETRQTEQRVESSQRIMDKLWFGGSVNLFWVNQRSFSQFLFGIAPMVGYKVTDNLSFGPRVEIQYTSYKIQTGVSGSETLNNFNFGGFGFGRYKFFRKFFIHVETGITTQPFIRTNPVGNPEFVRELRQPVLAGLGYSEGGGEIYILYDFNDPQRSTRFPIQYRFGFNYNF